MCPQEAGRVVAQPLWGGGSLGQSSSGIPVELRMHVPGARFIAADEIFINYDLHILREGRDRLPVNPKCSISADVSDVVMMDVGIYILFS